MNELQKWIDKYPVPVYEKDGYIPTAIFLLIGIGIVLLAVRLGGIEIVREVLR